MRYAELISEQIIERISILIRHRSNADDDRSPGGLELTKQVALLDSLKNIILGYDASTVLPKPLSQPDELVWLLSEVIVDQQNITLASVAAHL